MNSSKQVSSDSAILIESAKRNVAEAEKVVARKELLQKKMEKCDKTIRVLLGGRTIVKKDNSDISSKKAKRSVVLKKMTLSNAVEMVMTSSKKPMKVKNIALSVLAMGYRTKIKNPTYFASSVNKILRDNPNMKKVSHGVFKYSPKKTKKIA